ncbi:unnamed protein product, partial [Rotaria magnacalcarata]
MDTTDTNQSMITKFNVDRFRLPNESDQQWLYRKQFIDAFRSDYNEERLLCLAQCYANTKCLGCKYSEPLKSLLDQLSEKLSNPSGKRPTSQESIGINNKRNALMSNTAMSNVPLNSSFSSFQNFISFSSSFPSNPVPPPARTPPPSMPPQQVKQTPVDPKATLYESAETKLIRLRTFANQLKQFVEAAQNRTNSDENDRAIEDVYQIGNQQRLFIDYRPDDSINQLSSHGTHATSFLTQTFRGKLYIDEVYITVGQGTNKKFCKRNCFQQALNRFLNESFDVKLSLNKDGREQYELIKITSNEDQEDFGTYDDDEDKESFTIPSNHPMSNTKMNFVHARDTTTIAGRTARQQSKLEQHYWQQWGRGSPFFAKPKRIHRPLSPPPPVPHQTINNNTIATVEAVATTPSSVAAVIAEIEQAVQQQQQQENMNNNQFVNPSLTNTVDDQ